MFLVIYELVFFSPISSYVFPIVHDLFSSVTGNTKQRTRTGSKTKATSTFLLLVVGKWQWKVDDFAFL